MCICMCVCVCVCVYVYMYVYVYVFVPTKLLFRTSNALKGKLSLAYG